MATLYVGSILNENIKKILECLQLFDSLPGLHVKKEVEI